MSETEQTTDKQTIEQLTERYNSLNTKKIQAEAHLKSAETQLSELKKEAHKEYGTDDLDKLKEMLQAMETENEKKRADYQTSLDKIEGDLKKVEETYAVAADEN